MIIEKYYDRSFKVWVAYLKDETGNQVSHAEYEYKKEDINNLTVNDFSMYD